MTMINLQLFSFFLINISIHTLVNWDWWLGNCGGFDGNCGGDDDGGDNANFGIGGVTIWHCHNHEHKRIV